MLHRVMYEMEASFPCRTLLIDGQRDAIFELSAAQLINSIAQALATSDLDETVALPALTEEVELSTASERLRNAIAYQDDHIVLVFDEIDYLTPTSPTAIQWRSEFNKFWRNLRSVYQVSAADKKNLSILVSGVSSKWFSEESIDGVENAALSFVPEEYLDPLPRGAAGAMIRRLGKPAGLEFNDEVANSIADACAYMPFWIRKACSYLHRRIDIGLRPFEPQLELVGDYIADFNASDGIAMSEVALGHLFRVYPELKLAAMSCASGAAQPASPKMLRVLQKYGIVKATPEASVSGLMMSGGLLNFQADVGAVEVAVDEVAADFGDWADELAIISRRRNIIERKLRGMAINFLRFSSMSNAGAGSAKDRILKCVDAKRRDDLGRYGLDELSEKLYWLELLSIIKKEWPIFERVFGDRNEFDKFGQIVNERPDAHAKPIDQFDVGYHRTALTWLEDKINRV